ncbi:motility associated factor glycosyltransferase family protein [Psychrobacillus sp. NPDC058041]|uniref:motility associated factor glycosyltransferase family protein n=1 Tax=Psychrobacillus sp. NPDC058041 TaxID=3346310 RepID=UPI0036DD7BB8
MYKVTKELNKREIEVIKIFDNETNKIIPLNSEISPLKEIERFCQPINNNMFYFIIGSGNGTILEYLLNKKYKSKFYILEVFDEINYSDEYIETLKEQNINLFYNSKLNYLELSGAIRNSMGMDCEVLIHPNYDRVNAGLLSPIVEKIKMGIVTATINKNTENYFKFEWITEPILNLSITKEARSILEIRDNFIDKDVILVSSGPSMSDHIDFMKKNIDSAYIIASGSAVNGLINNNIMPDFVTIMDGSLINYTAHFEKTQYTGPIITTGTTNHSILKNHKGEIFVTNFAQDSITATERKDLLNVPNVPSVALYSLLLSHFLGAKNVYMVGQDLALANGQYYASGVSEHANMKKLGETIEVESNNGSVTHTTFGLASTLESFNNVVSIITKTNSKLQIYNLAKDGAKIKDVPYINSEDIELGNKIEKSWINRSEDKVNLNYTYSADFLSKIEACKKDVDYAVRKINQMNLSAVSLKDLKKVLLLIKSLRENEVLETHILNMLYSTTKSINNMFEYGFEDNFETNQERVEMIKKFKIYIEYIQKYLLGLLESPVWIQLDKERL